MAHYLAAKGAIISMTRDRHTSINDVVEFVYFLTIQWAPHYAAKGGLVTFTVSLAREMAKYEINVNAVAPGIMRIPISKKTLADREKEYIKRIPLGRIADPREVAYAIAFLILNKFIYITGATIERKGLSR